MIHFLTFCLKFMCLFVLNDYHIYQFKCNWDEKKQLSFDSLSNFLSLIHFFLNYHIYQFEYIQLRWKETTFFLWNYGVVSSHFLKQSWKIKVYNRIFHSPPILERCRRKKSQVMTFCFEKAIVSIENSKWTVPEKIQKGLFWAFEVSTYLRWFVALPTWTLRISVSKHF